MTIGVGIIGFGAMGNLVADRIADHPHFELIGIYDPAVSKQNSKLTQGLIFDSAESLVNDDSVQLVYIATPPKTHIHYCYLALDANRAIWCEKPLSVDVKLAELLVDRIEQSEAIAAVNLSIASNPNLIKLEKLTSELSLERIHSIEMRFHYPGWTREDNDWFGSREQGGFLREVFSNFAFMQQRLLGSLALVHGEVEFSIKQGSEQYVNAYFSSRGVPIRLSATIGGAAPEMSEWLLYSEESSLRLTDLELLEVGSQQGWKTIADQAVDSVNSQLNEVVKMMNGQPHRLASFYEAFKVQRLIEQILGSSR